jgi:hypothetical protein
MSEADILNSTSKLINNIPNNSNIRLTSSSRGSLLSNISVSKKSALNNNFSEPFTDPASKKVTDAEKFEVTDEEFPNLNPQEQAILKQISGIINGSL